MLFMKSTSRILRIKNWQFISSTKFSNKELTSVKQTSTQHQEKQRSRSFLHRFRFELCFTICFGSALFIYQRLQKTEGIHPNQNKGVTLEAEAKKLVKFLKGDLKLRRTREIKNKEEE